MQLKLEGKVALITGSSKGIGKSIAEYLHKEGCKVILNSRNGEGINNISTGLCNSVFIEADVTDPIQAKNLVSKSVSEFGKLDILICNVGSGKSVAPGMESHIEWQRMFDLNFFSTTNMVESALEELSKTNGSIVCISSICGLEVIENAPVTYSVAKSALNSYIKGIARPLSKRNIRINAIAAGNMLFQGSTWESKLHDDKQTVLDFIKKQVPMNGFGNPLDLATLVAYLCSNYAQFVTGSIWNFDGGQAH